MSSTLKLQKVNSRSNSTESKTKKTVSVAVSLFLAIAILVGSLLFLISRDDYSGPHPAEPSLEIVSNHLLPLALGDEISVTDNELNALLVYLVEGQKNTPSSTGFALRGVICDFKKCSDAIELVLPVSFKGFKFSLLTYLKISPSENTQKIQVKLLKSGIGKLPVPDKWLAKKLAENFPEFLQHQEGTLLIEPTINFSFKNFPVQLKIDTLEFKNNQLRLKTSGAKGAIKKFLKSQVGSWG